MQDKIKTDVLVAGAGLAGVAAAIGAARQGAEVVLVEASTTLGGTATAGLNCSFQGVDVEMMGGVGREIIERLIDRSGAIHGVYTPFSVETLKDICFEMLEEVGVKLRFGMFADEALMADSQVNGVVFRSKSRRELVRAQAVVDTTGDGDVAFMAGAPFEDGDPQTGERQPVTLLFRMGNVEIDEVLDYIEATPGQFYKEELLFVCDRTRNPPLVIANGFFDWVRDQKAKGLYLGREAIAIINTPNPREVLINATRTAEIDGLDPEALTRAMIDTRKQVRSLVERLVADMPGFRESYVVDTASLLGIRETRRILGEYQLTEDDVAEGREFEDGIARNFFPIDIHGPRSNPGGYTWIVPRGNGTYTIPVRCLIPRKVDGLVVGGRCISTTHVAFGSTRSMPCCIATGQAAGVTAAISADKGRPARTLDHRQIQQALQAQGVNL